MDSLPNRGHGPVGSDEINLTNTHQYPNLLTQEISEILGASGGACGRDSLLWR